MTDKQESDRQWFYGILRRYDVRGERLDELETIHRPYFKILADYHARPTREAAITFPLPSESDVEGIAARLLPAISVLTGETAERLVPFSASQPMPRPSWMSSGGYAAAMRAALGECLGASLMESALPQFLRGRKDDDHVRRAQLYEAQRKSLGGCGLGTAGMFSHILDAGTWIHRLNTRLVRQCAQTLNRSLFHHIALTAEGRHDEAALFAQLLAQPYAPIAGRLISGDFTPRANVPGAWYILIR